MERERGSVQRTCRTSGRRQVVKGTCRRADVCSGDAATLSVVVVVRMKLRRCTRGSEDRFSATKCCGVEFSTSKQAVRSPSNLGESHFIQ